MNPIFSGVTTYVDENRDLIYGKIMLDIPFIKEFTLQPNAKGGQIALPILNTSVLLQNGAQCGVSGGTADITQRTMYVANLQTSTPYCENVMLPYFTGIKCKVGETADESAYAEAFMNAEVTKINKALETMIWQGQSGSTSCDGIYTIAATDGEEVTVATGSTVYEREEAVRLAAAAAGVEDYVIALGADEFYALAAEINAKNLYHVAVETRIDGVLEFVLPLTNTRVWGVRGLNGSKAILAFDPQNIHYGFDEEVGVQSVKWAVDEVNDIAYLKTKFNAGIQIAFPNEVYYNVGE